MLFAAAVAGGEITAAGLDELHPMVLLLEIVSSDCGDGVQVQEVACRWGFG